MKKTLFIAIIFILTSILAAYASTCEVAAPQKNGQADPEALEFVNKSKMTLTGIYVSPSHEKDRWSENLLGETPLKENEKRYLDISRNKIIGLCNVKLVYDTGKENTLDRVPLLEIFSMKHNSVGGLEYKRIKRAS